MPDEADPILIIGCASCRFWAEGYDPFTEKRSETGFCLWKQETNAAAHPRVKGKHRKRNGHLETAYDAECEAWQLYDNEGAD